MDDDGGGDGDDDYDNDNEDNDNDDNDDDGEDDDDARRTASAHCWIVCHIATREIRRERGRSHAASLPFGVALCDNCSALHCLPSAIREIETERARAKPQPRSQPPLQRRLA